MTEIKEASTNMTSLLINVPPFLRKFPYWAACGTPKDKLDDENPTKKAPLNTDGYGSWDNLYPTPEAAYEAMLKMEHGHCISFIIPPEPILVDGKLVVCCDFDFKNPATIVHPDAPRHDNVEKLGDFVTSCSTYCEFSLSGMGYHVWALAEIPVPDKPISDKNGVGIFFKRQNVVFTGKVIPGSQIDVHTIPLNVLMKINLWSKGPNSPVTTSTIGIGGSKFELPDKILDGTKHTCFRDFALSMANRGMTVNELMFACQAMNENGRVVPPVSQSDMDTKVKNLCITAVRKVTKEKAEKSVHPEYAKLYSYKLVPRGEGFEEKLVLNHIEIVEWLHNKYNTVSFNDELFTYDCGVYVPNSNLCENELRIFLKEIKVEGTIMGTVREIMGRLRIYEPKRDYPFNKQRGMLPVDNGILVFDFKNRKVELKPHSPEYLFTIKLPVTYDPKASPLPIYDNVLSGYVDPDHIPVLFMVPAMAILQLINGRVYKKSVICEGSGNSGKTTYLELIQELFGKKYCTQVSLHQLVDDKFAASQLEGKIINNFDELSDIQLGDIGLFKLLTGRQDHRIEKKGQDGYETVLTAFHLFACNKPPKVKDELMYDDAFWNRWIYLRFPNVYEIDMTFKERNFTPEAISGFLNDVIAMVLEIECYGKLPFNPDPSETMRDWLDHADPFRSFLMKHTHDTQNFVNFNKEYFYSCYLHWCKQSDNRVNIRNVPQSQTSFTQSIFKYGITVFRGGNRTKTKDDREYVYRQAREWNADSIYKPKDGTPVSDQFIGLSAFT
jgi:phage/plasmid-associated DNA primase